MARIGATGGTYLNARAMLMEGSSGVVRGWTGLETVDSDAASLKQRGRFRGTGRGCLGRSGACATGQRTAGRQRPTR